MAAADINKHVSFGTCRVSSLTGFNAQGADLYIQLFEASPLSGTVVVPNGTVPKLSILAQQANGFKYEYFQGLTFSELTVCVSSTQATLTAVAAAGGVDVVIDADGPYLVPNFPTFALVGDLVGAAVSTLQVWAEAAGPNRLVRITAINADATPRYVVGYAVDAPTIGTSLKQFQNYLPNANQVEFNSGQGVYPYEKLADQTAHAGLTLKVQQTPNFGGISQTAQLRAMYI